MIAITLALLAGVMIASGGIAAAQGNVLEGLVMVAVGAVMIRACYSFAGG